MPQALYQVIVRVRDPHGGATRAYTERILADSPTRARQLAIARHVGGRFTDHYVSAPFVRKAY